MKRVVAICAVILALGVAQAQAYPVPAVGPAVEVREEPCPDRTPELACAFPGTIYIDPAYIRPGTRTWLEALWHERGHEADYFLLNDAERAEFEGLVGAGGPWEGESSVEPDHQAPREKFADAYMMCRLRSLRDPAIEARRGRYIVNMSGFNPGERLYRRACRWLADLSS